MGFFNNEPGNKTKTFYHSELSDGRKMLDNFAQEKARKEEEAAKLGMEERRRHSTFTT